MTLPRLNHMTKYWADSPPIHISMSAVLQGLSGGTQRKRSEPRIPTDKNGNPTKGVPTDIQTAARMLGGNVIRPKRKPTDNG